MKRFITTHDDSTGKAVFDKSIPEDNERKLLPDGIATFALGYTTKTFPVELNDDQDIKHYNDYLHNAPGLTLSNGTVLRTVDMAPGALSPMHRTVSLDYGVVLEGEVELVLDSGETRVMKRGDQAVQRGTMHAWRNLSKTEWARMMYVLQPALPVKVGGKELVEELGTMVGVKKSD